MTQVWSLDRVLQLAPDASSAKAGRELAHAGKWKSLGCADGSLWGELQGSGKNPYQTQIDLTEPAFKCTCPSRKFPCKHGLGLLLIYAENAAAVKAAAQPEWVSKWIGDRAARAQKKVEKQEAAAAVEVADPEAQAKRAAKREAKVNAGLEELDRWLRDLVRQGLAAAQTQPGSFWDKTAARMVDAQAPGIARLVRELAAAVHSGQGWQERVLERAASVFLLIQAWRRLESLDQETQAAVRSLVGFTKDQDEVLRGEGVRDTWAVVGRRIEEEDRLKVQRTWLLGRNTQRAALILNFASSGQTLDTSLVVGTDFDGEIVFFPGAGSLRALVKTRNDSPREVRGMTGHSSLDQMRAASASVLAANPWIESWPALLASMRLQRAGDSWTIRDSENRTIPVSRQFDRGWELLSISGSEPIAVFGEWDGRSLLPLSAAANDRFFDFTRGIAS